MSLDQEVLYTSILPNLIVPEIGEAVTRAKAKKVYICNLMTQKGETYGFTASDHVKAIYDHIGTSFYSIQSLSIMVKYLTDAEIRYKEEYAEPVIVDKKELEQS